MTRPYNLFLAFLLGFSTHSVFSQLTYAGKLSLKGMGSTNENRLPFWMYHNQRGRISEDTNFAAWVSGKGVNSFSNNSVLEVGAGLLARDGGGDEFFVDELYAHYKAPYWSFTVGRKQQEELYNGLSSSNRNILWSLNARPLPGLQLQTSHPIFLLKNLGIEAEWEEYLMDDDRFVDNTRLHHKSLHLVYSTRNRKFQFKAGIQHFAQWGGTSPLSGQQPVGLKDYFKIVTGLQGSEGATVSDQLNALGNHLGGYEFSVSKQFPNFELELFYQHIFEDGSGRRLGNTPDGRYGLFLNVRDPFRLINSLMYEFYTTHHQSHTTTGPHKNDNYFNNTGYRSGWTYHQQVMGAPFFTADPEASLWIVNNKFTAHHLGLGGFLPLTATPLPYKLLLSYVQNDGRRDIRYTPKQDAFYILYDISLLQKAVEVNLQLGAEYDSYKAPVYGVGMHLVYRL